MIENEIISLLCAKNYTVTTAESCTGGMIASTLVSVAGASDCYREGYITYSNEAKQKNLGVLEETLSKYGAVSEQTAEEMAMGALRVADADFSIVSTGIAGPGGGTKDKPVGLVYISCAYAGGVRTTRNVFSGDRTQVREAATTCALTLLLDCIKENG